METKKNLRICKKGKPISDTQQFDVKGSIIMTNEGKSLLLEI